MPTAPPEAQWLVVEVEGSGIIAHPLPLPAGMTPAEMVQQLAEVMGREWAARAGWTLTAARPVSGSLTPLQEWAPVATAGEL